jgi:hypothetical protein
VLYEEKQKKKNFNRAKLELFRGVNRLEILFVGAGGIQTDSELFGGVKWTFPLFIKAILEG